MNKPQYLYQFSQLSTSLFDTLVVKKLTGVSKSGLDLFIINNNFSTNKWNNYPFFSLIFLTFFITFNHFLVSGYVTDVLTSSQSISMHSSNCSAISTFIVLYFISILIPNKVWSFPLRTDISPNFFFT